MSLCGKNGMAQLEGKLLIIFAGILPCGTLYRKDTFNQRTDVTN